LSRSFNNNRTPKATINLAKLGNVTIMSCASKEKV
jgi:hypothetical protein